MSKLLNQNAFLITVAGVAIAFWPIAAQYIHRYSLSISSAAGIYGCFLLLLILALAPGFHSSGHAFGRYLAGRTWLQIALLLASYLIYEIGTADFRAAAWGRLLLVSVPVFAIYRVLPVRDSGRLAWQDRVAGAWLVCAVLFHVTNGIWSVPANLDFMARLFMLATGALCWTYTRPVPELGYELVVNGRVLKAAALNFLYFAAVAIPLGFALHFTAWNPRWTGVAGFLASYLEILLFVAALEELFFRGFLQNLIGKSLASPLGGQLIVSMLFGLFHILHAPFPNWRYVILASIAGWFYGAAYRSGGTLLTSMLVHAAVDTFWRAFLTKP